MTPEEIFKSNKLIQKIFFRWVYNLNINGDLKFLKGSVDLTKFYSTHTYLMKDWHNHIDPDKFAHHAAVWGYDYTTCIQVAKSICSEKKMKELLDAV